MSTEARKKASSHWLAGAMDPKKKGALHRALGVPMGTKIPLGKLQGAAKGDTKLAARARLALTMRGFKH